MIQLKPKKIQLRENVNKHQYYQNHYTTSNHSADESSTKHHQTKTEHHICAHNQHVTT